MVIAEEEVLVCLKCMYRLFETLEVGQEKRPCTFVIVCSNPLTALLIKIRSLSWAMFIFILVLQLHILSLKYEVTLNQGFL
jgi:C4-type Zn-finger protein